MSKDKEVIKSTKAAPEAETAGRPARKKVYQPVRQGTLPDNIKEFFKASNYDLKLIRWVIEGEEDYRYLHRREEEGYEFVTKEELPDWFMRSVKVMDTKSRPGLVMMGDLCLMKIDTDLRNSRRNFYQQKTDGEVASVDIHVLEKKGFRNLGTKSKVLMREPKFQE